MNTFTWKSIWRIRHTRNAQHFGGVEQLPKLYNRVEESKKSTTKCIKYVLTKSSRIMV